MSAPVYRLLDDGLFYRRACTPREVALARRLGIIGAKGGE